MTGGFYSSGFFERDGTVIKYTNNRAHIPALLYEFGLWCTRTGRFVHLTKYRGVLVPTLTDLLMTTDVKIFTEMETDQMSRSLLKWKRPLPF